MRRVGKGSGEKFRWCGAEDKSGGLFSRFMAVICVGVFLRLLRQMARCWWWRAGHSFLSSWVFWDEKCWDVEMLIMPCSPPGTWIWTSWVLVMVLRNGDWWVQTLIVPKPCSLLKESSLLRRKTKKNKMKMVEMFWWWKVVAEVEKMVVAEMGKVVADDFDAEKWLLKNFLSKKMLLKNLLSKKVVVCGLCDGVKWSRKEEDV
jgi:hypothetical protein